MEFGRTEPGAKHREATTIAVVADTHLDHFESLPPRLLDALEKADVIIHLGDYHSKAFVDELRKSGKFHGITGNHDNEQIRQELNQMEVVEVAGKRLGLIHGMIFPFGTQKRMKARFREDKIDILLYGHTHLATSRHVDGVFVFNPGTVTAQFPAYRGSFGMLSLDGSITAEIISLDCQNNPKKGLIGRLWALFLTKSILLIETWPYLDLPYYAANIWSKIKKSYISTAKFFVRSKYSDNL
jgi:putative phosphoesterase